MLAYVTGRSGRKRMASMIPMSNGTPTTTASRIQKRRRHRSIGRFLTQPLNRRAKSLSILAGGIFRSLDTSCAMSPPFLPQLLAQGAITVPEEQSAIHVFGVDVDVPLQVNGALGDPRGPRAVAHAHGFMQRRLAGL